MRIFLSTIEHFANTNPALSDERRAEEYARAKSSVRRREILAGAGLLRHALAESSFAVPEGPLPVRYTDEGKPYLADGPCYSISHSGELIACAIAEEPVGLDIERVSRFTGTKVARKILNEAEMTAYRALPDHAAARYLADVWTAKEAIAKLLGKGITIPFDELRACGYRMTVWSCLHEGEEYFVRTARMR